MKFYIQHKPADALWTFDIILMGDVRENALVVSRLFPSDEIVVWAHSRGRLVVRNGEVIRDVPQYDHFFEVDSSKVSDQLKMHEWKHLIASGEDMPLVLGTSTALVTMESINDSYRNMPRSFREVAKRLGQVAYVELPLMQGPAPAQIAAGMKFLDSVFRLNDDKGITQSFGDIGIKDLELLLISVEEAVREVWFNGVPVNVFSDEAVQFRNPNLPTPLIIGDLLAILRLRYTYMLAYLRLTDPDFRNWKSNAGV